MSEKSTQPTFTKGELTHRLVGRIDINEYGQGVSDAENYTVLAQGAFRKRSGTGFIGRTKDMSSKSNLIPFVFSTSQAYVLEFGDHYIRFFALRGQVVSGPAKYEIVSPYAIADVFNLKFIQINDIIYMTNKKYPVQKITRIAETNWTITPVNYFNGPYLDKNITSTYLTASNLAKPAGTGVPVAAWDNISTALINLGAGFPQLISYTFAGSPIKVDGYSVHFATTSDNQAIYAARMIRSWTFEGLIPSTSTWVILDNRRVETDWLGGEERLYTFKNDTAYQAYRFNVTKNNGDVSSTYVAEFTLKVKEYPMSLTFSSTVGINKNAGFTSADIGRFIQFRTGDGFNKAFKITGVSSTTIVTGLYYGTWNFVSQNITEWSLGAFSAFTGYPAAIADWEGRVVLGGSVEEPRTLWFSDSTDLEGYAKNDPQVDSDPVTLTLSGSQNNEILWLSPGKGLFVGTTDGITSVASGAPDGVFTYKSVQQVIQTNFGSSSITPVRVGPAVLYSSYYGSTIRELIYSFNEDSYDAPDISLFSEHLLSSTVVGMAWSRAPDNILYLITSIGTLVALTYDRVQKVVGLTPYTTDGLIESAAVIPGINRRDDIYVQVQRTINGAVCRYVEYLNDPFEYQADNEAWFVDCGLTYHGAGVNVLTGLSHLEGKFVAVVVTQPLAAQLILGIVTRPIFGNVVLGGSLTLPSGVNVTDCIVGLPYTANLTIMPARVPSRDGQSSYTRKSRVDRVAIDMYRTAGIEINSPGTDQWTDVVERAGYNLMDQTLPLYTGYKDVAIEGSWDAQGVFTIRSQFPLPSMIRSVTSVLEKES